MLVHQDATFAYFIRRRLREKVNSGVKISDKEMKKKKDKGLSRRHKVIFIIPNFLTLFRYVMLQLFFDQPVINWEDMDNYELMIFVLIKHTVLVRIWRIIAWHLLSSGAFSMADARLLDTKR
jgi:hypothetical protein